MATYKDVSIWVTKEYGFTVKTGWIAHVKEMCGLPLKEASNRKSATQRVNACPSDKVDAIKTAFRYFGMI